MPNNWGLELMFGVWIKLHHNHANNPTASSWRASGEASTQYCPIRPDSLLRHLGRDQVLPKAPECDSRRASEEHVLCSHQLQVQGRLTHTIFHTSRRWREKSLQLSCIGVKQKAPECNTAQLQQQITRCVTHTSFPHTFGSERRQLGDIPALWQWATWCLHVKKVVMTFYVTNNDNESTANNSLTQFHIKSNKTIVMIHSIVMSSI